MNRTNKKSILLLVLFLFAVSTLLYHTTIFLPPSFIHAWTQSERYAIALQFLQNGFDIFHPSTFNLQTLNGVTRMDFPLNEFIVALLMKLFGTTSPIVFRLYTLCVSVTGLTFLYLLAKKITESEIKSYLVVLFVFLSPMFTYYQAGFIPSIHAVAFVFIAYYYFYNYKKSGERKDFIISVFFFLIAAMVRIPFLMFLFSIFLQQMYLFIKTKRFFRSELFVLGVAILFFIGHYAYVIHLGNVYGNVFLSKFLPAKNWNEFLEILNQMHRQWQFQYLTFWHYTLLIICVFIAIKSYIKTKVLENKELWFNLFFIGGGALLYFLLMARQYYDHDYYMLDSLFVPVVLLFLLTIKYIKQESEMQKVMILFFACIAIFFMYGDSRRNQIKRYSFDESDRTERTRQNFVDAEKFLDSIGISKSSKMLILESYSSNIPLYMMNRKGYSVVQLVKEDPRTILFSNKWDYVVIQDQFLFSDVLKYYPVIASVIEPVAGNGKIMVYKRNPHPKKRSVEELLQLNKKKLLIEEMNDFEGNQNGHFTTTENILFSEQFSKYAILDSANEYGISFKVGANELNCKGNAFIKVSLDFLSSDLSGVKIVATTANKEKTIHYQSYLLSDFYKNQETKQKGMFYFTLPAFYNANDILSVYLWNPSKKFLLYDNFKVAVYSNR